MSVIKSTTDLFKNHFILKREVGMGIADPSNKVFSYLDLLRKNAFILIAGIFLSLIFIAKGGAAEPIHLPVNLPGMKGAEYVGTDTCATCHEKQYKEYELSTHARLDVKGIEGAASGCEMCHGPGSNHVNAGGSKGIGKEGGTIINPRKHPEICFSCHMDKKMEFRLPYHHPVLEGHMSCTDCHDPHGEDVRPWTTTSMQDVNEVCFKSESLQNGFKR